MVSKNDIFNKKAQLKKRISESKSPVLLLIDNKKVEWELTPVNIYQYYQEKKIDRCYALSLLEVFYYRDKYPSMNEIDKINLIMDYIVSISRKNKKLKALLEEMFITEFWYQIKFNALSHLCEHFPRKAKALYRYSLENEKCIPFILRRLPRQKLESLEKILEIDPLLLLYIKLKDVLYATAYFNFNKFKRGIYDKLRQLIIIPMVHHISDTISKEVPTYYHIKKLTRFKRIRQLSAKELLELSPVKNFNSDPQLILLERPDRTKG